MRKQVKLAKIHIIRKLNRRQQVLKSKKGNDEEKRKNLEKADRLLEEIQEIKRLEIDRISKFALANTKSFAEVVKEATAKSELRTLARIVEHKAISNSVLSFRNKFPKWEKELPVLMSMWEIRKKFNQSDSKKRPDKPNSVSVKSIKTDSKRNKLKNVNTDSKRMKTTKKAAVSINTNSLQSVSSNVSINEASDRDSEKGRTLINQVEKEPVKSYEATSFPSHVVEKKYGEKEIKKLNLTGLDSDLPDVKVKSETSFKTTDLETVPKRRKRKDDFFISENQTDTEGADDSEVDDNDSVSSDNDTVHFTNKPSFGGNLRNSKYRKGRNTSFEKPIKQKSKFGSWQRKSTPNNGKDRNFKNFHDDRKDQTHKENTQHLHPSWEAKKKLQEQQKQLFVFQGKKIKFDD